MLAHEIRDPQEQSASNLTCNFNNAIQQFQNTYDEKRKGVIEMLELISEENQMLLTKRFEVEESSQRAKQRIQQNQNEISSFEAELARIDTVKD